MTKTLTTRSLLLAGALAFAALPVLAQTAPSTQPVAPAAGAAVTTSAPTGKSTTDAGKSATNATKTHHTKKLAAAHSKSKIHTVSTKKTTDTKVQKPTTGGTSSGGTTAPTKNP